MVEIEDPLTGATLDPFEPVESASSIGKGVAAVSFGIAMVKGGQWVYNQIAEETPDQMGTATVF